MTDLTDKIERVTGPSRCPGAAPETFWAWPMPMGRLLIMTTAFGVLVVFAGLLVFGTSIRG
jgi:hypothetical protein